MGLFFVIAGYLFAFNNDNFSSLLSKKFKTLIIPWVFTGTAVYLYKVIRKGGASVFSYIKWILGSGTYLWYMVTLLLLYLIFGICRRWKISIYFVPILGLVSYLLNGYLYKFLSPWGGQYYNVFNWMIFFTAGYAVALFNLEEKLSDFLKKFGLVISVILIVFSVYLLLNNIELFYWKLLYLPYEFIFCLTALFLAQIIKKFEIIKRIGAHSFAIYLLHMPIAGIVCFAISKPSLILLRPFVVILIVELFITAYLYIVNKFFPKNKMLKTVLGLR